MQDYLIPYTPPPSTITSVSVSCSPSSVQVNQTAQCTSTVSGTGSYSTATSWGSSPGTVTQSGFYTAPSTVPAGGTTVVAAASIQDSSKYGQAVLTITAAPPPPTVTGVTVSCSPTTVLVNQTAQCSAAVSGTGSYSSAVNWSANVGSVNASGLFIAPATVPNPAAASVTATSVQNTAKSGTQSLAIAASTSWSLSNANVFLDTTGTGWYIEQWAGVTNNPTSPIAYSGDYGVESKTTTQWGRVQFTTWANYRFNTSGYSSISFWINIGQDEGEVLYIGLLNSGLAAIQYVNIANTAYIENGTLNPYQWKLVTIPLPSLGGTSTNIYGVEFQSANPATFNVDQITFNTGACPQ